MAETDLKFMTDSNYMNAKISNNRNALIRALYEKAIREHYVCDDYFYSCPMAEEPTWSDKLKECDCGAEQHNREVEDLYIKILTLIQHIY